jgi:hypothetical protein
MEDVGEKVGRMLKVGRMHPTTGLLKAVWIKQKMMTPSQD